MRTLLWFVLLLVAAGNCHSQVTEYPEAPSSIYPSYPHVWFVLESSALTVAVIENGRARTNEYYSNAIEHPASTTVGRYAAINSAVYAGVMVGSWKLERSHKKPLRLLGHGLIWGAVAYYSASYFLKP